MLSLCSQAFGAAPHISVFKPTILNFKLAHRCIATLSHARTHTHAHARTHRQTACTHRQTHAHTRMHTHKYTHNTYTHVRAQHAQAQAAAPQLGHLHPAAWPHLARAHGQQAGVGRASPFGSFLAGPHPHGTWGHSSHVFGVFANHLLVHCHALHAAAGVWVWVWVCVFTCIFLYLWKGKEGVYKGRGEPVAE
jgi:hypothetical protein